VSRIIKAKIKGRKLFQVKFIRRSYRIRGKVPRIQMNEEPKNAIFRAVKKSAIGELERADVKMQVVNNLIAKILVYSAIKISAKGPLLYSVLNPETSSDSPSARSKGVRFVSASIVVNHKRKTGRSIKIIQVYIWKDIEVKL